MVVMVHTVSLGVESPCGADDQLMARLQVSDELTSWSRS